MKKLYYRLLYLLITKPYLPWAPSFLNSIKFSKNQITKLFLPLFTLFLSLGKKISYKIELINTFFTQMLSRGSGNNIQKVISFMEQTQMAKSVLALNKIITNPQTVHELVESAKIKTASAHIVEQSLNYIDNANAGTTIMRTNFLASVATHIQYPIKEIEKHIKNPKISYVEIARDTKAPVRALIETRVINKFADNFHPYIENIQLTNDVVTVTSEKSRENVNPDALVTYQTSEGVVQKAMDVKMTNLNDDYLRGHIREINIYKKEIIKYPNTHEITLPEYYNNMYIKIAQILKMDYLKSFITSSNMQRLNEKTKEFYELLKKNNTNIDELLKNHRELEKVLMEINIIPGFPRTPTFMNIHHIQDTPLTSEEMKFLEFMANKADHLTLSKESFMTNYLIESLKTYRELFDNKTYENLKPLVKVYPWLKRGLGNYIPENFYTS